MIRLFHQDGRRVGCVLVDVRRHDLIAVRDLICGCSIIASSGTGEAVKAAPARALGCCLCSVERALARPARRPPRDSPARAASRRRERDSLGAAWVLISRLYQRLGRGLTGATSGTISGRVFRCGLVAARHHDTAADWNRPASHTNSRRRCVPITSFCAQLYDAGINSGGYRNLLFCSPCSPACRTRVQTTAADDESSNNHVRLVLLPAEESAGSTRRPARSCRAHQNGNIRGHHAAHARSSKTPPTPGWCIHARHRSAAMQRGL